MSLSPILLGLTNTVVFRVDNTGGQTLTGLNVTKSGANADDFTLVQPSLTDLSANQYDFFTVQYQLKTPGPHTVTLHVASNDPDENPFDLTLQVTGVDYLLKVDAPDGSPIAYGTLMDYGTVVPGASKSLTLTLRNTGTLDLFAVGASVWGTSEQSFLITRQPADRLAPGESTTMTCTFTPVSHNMHTAELRISNSHAGFRLPLKGLGQGPEIKLWRQPVVTEYIHNSYDYYGLLHMGATSATKSILVKNVGTAPLTDLSASVKGACPEDYVILNPLPSVLDRGQSAILEIRFKPTAIGVRSAYLDILSNDLEEGDFHINMGGEGAIPEIHVEELDGTEIPSGTLHDFGTWEITKINYVEHYIRIKNLGLGTLAISHVGPEGGDAGEFGDTLAPPQYMLPVRIAQGAAAVVLLRYLASTPGVKNSKFIIRSMDLDEPVYEIPLKATGTRAELTLEHPAGTPVSLATGRTLAPVAIGGSGDFPLILKNSGTAPLTPTVTLTGTNASLFTLLSAPTGPVAPGDSVTVILRYAPQSLVPQVATLRVNGNFSKIYAQNTIDIPLTATGALSTIAFSAPVYRVRHGDSVALVTLTRSPAQTPSLVRLDTTEGAPSTVPPFLSAVAGTDYTPLSGQSSMIGFAAGEAQKTVQIPLLAPAARASSNRQINLTLSEPEAGTQLGSPAQAILQILGTDLAKPTLTLKTPAAGKLGDVLPLLVTGIAGDARGVERVEVKLDGAAPLAATLGTTTDPKAVPFSMPLPALADGAHTLVVTAYDLVGNSTTVTRTFTFTRKYPFTVEMRDVGTGELIANAASLAVTYTGGTPLVPSQPTAATRTTALADGTAVKIVATPAKGYALHHWSHTPLGPPTANIFTQGHIASFATLAAPQGNQSTTVQLWVMPTPFNPPSGGSNTLYWYLPPDPLSPYTKLGGFLSATVTPTGSFSCKLTQAGVTYPFNGFFLGSGYAVLIYKGHYATGILFSGRSLRLRHLDGMTAPQAGFDSFTGLANIPWVTGRWGRYSATNKVPNQGLNPPAYTKGSYTMSLKPSDRLQPLPTAQPYPRGAGYASWTLTPLGQATLAGALADGTTFTSSSTLVRGAVNADEVAAPVFLELAPLGSTKKSILLAGDALFDFSSAATVNGDFQWLRPASTDPKVTPYPQGWPGGFYLAGAGRMYLGTQDLQTALSLGPYVPGQANASLTFNLGGLTSSVTKSSFAINKNAIVKLPPADASYTLSIAPVTGLITGTFTPNWSNPSTTKPAFKGILVQGVGAEGFFLHNAKTPLPDKDASGTVSLGAPPP